MWKTTAMQNPREMIFQVNLGERTRKPKAFSELPFGAFVKGSGWDRGGGWGVNLRWQVPIANLQGFQGPGQGLHIVFVYSIVIPLLHTLNNLKMRLGSGEKVLIRVGIGSSWRRRGRAGYNETHYVHVWKFKEEKIENTGVSSALTEVPSSLTDIHVGQPVISWVARRSKHMHRQTRTYRALKMIKIKF